MTEKLNLVRVGIDVPYQMLRQGVWFLVICERPSDFPEHVTMRVQGALMNQTIVYGEWCGLYSSVAEARADVPPHAHKIAPQPGEDPVIKEVWML